MPEGFKIADGYVEVHVKLDERGVHRSAHDAADIVEDDIHRRADRDNRDSSSGFWARLFRPNPTLSRILPGWFEAFASPFTATLFAIGVAAGLEFIAGFIASGLLVTLGGAIIGLGAFILHQNKNIVREWEKLADTAQKIFTRAAKPLVLPFVQSLGIITRALRALEPVFSNIFAGIAPVVVPLTRAFTAFSSNFLKQIERSMPGIRQILTVFAEEFPDLGTAIGHMFKQLADNAPLIADGLRLVFTWLQVFVNSIAPILLLLTMSFVGTALAWNKTTRAIYIAAIAVKDAVIAAWGFLTKWIPQAWSSVIDFFVGIGDFFVGLWNGIISFFQGVWQSITNTVITALTFLYQTIWVPFWSVFGEFFKAIFNLIAAFFKLWLVGIEFVIKSVLQGVFTYWVIVWTAVSTVFQTIWNFIAAFFQMIWRKIEDPVKTTVGFIKGLIVGAWNFILGSTIAIWNAVYNAVAGPIKRAFNTLVGWRNSIFDFFKNAGKWLFNAGANIIQGLIDGITSMLNKLTDKINKAAELIRDHLPFSPAKRGALSGSGNPEIAGMKISGMIAEGIRKGMPAINSALATLPGMQVAVAGAGGPVAFGPQTANNQVEGGNTFIINIHGVWDFTNPSSARQIVAKIYDGIENYKREHVR